MLEPPGFWLTFSYYFAVTNLIVIGIFSQRLGLNWLDPSIYPLSICVGLITGLLGANFNRSVTIEVPFKRKAEFLKILNKELADMDFVATSELENFTVYQKSNFATLFSGRIFVKTEGKTATIIGRASAVKKLESIA